MSESEKASGVKGDAGARKKRSSSQRRRRRRQRRRNNNKAATQTTQQNAQQAQQAQQIDVQGLLWIRDDGNGMLLDPEGSFGSPLNGTVVPSAMIRQQQLQSGLLVEGKASKKEGKTRLTTVSSVEGLDPKSYGDKIVPFADLVSIDPDQRFSLETEPNVIEPRVAELISPIGKGQRCLIVSPPKAGKTTLLQQIAHAIAHNHPEAVIFVLLVDERPEEVTDWRRSIVRGQVFASSSDQSIQSHIRVSEVVAERARRLVELGQDVVVFMDSLTRMSRAYNNAQKGSGRILSGGIDARTMEKPRRFFGAARKAEAGGSLTIIATCLIDTGSRMDEVIFQEFKGTGNMELVLDRRLFEKRIFPCINMFESGTRKEEKLYPREQVEKLYLMRRALSSLSPESAMELLLQKVREFSSNERFLSSLNLG